MTDDPKPEATYVPTGGYRIDQYPTYEEGIFFARKYWDFYGADCHVNPDPAYFTDERLAELGREPV